MLAASLVHPLIISVLAQPGVARSKKTCAMYGIRHCEKRLVAVAGAYSNALAALGAAARKHRCPCLGLHPRQKAVGLRSVAPIGLKCALGHNTALLYLT